MKNEIPDNTLGERKPPPTFEYFNFKEKTDVLEFCFTRDVFWACAAAFTTPDSVSNSSSTNIKQKISIPKYKKSLLEYLQVITQPPEYPVCKTFLDDAIDL